MAVCTQGKFRCGGKLSTSKTNKMAFKARDPVNSQIVINNNIIKKLTFLITQVTLFYKRMKRLLLLQYQYFSS
jgi:hypothetical protein